MYQIGRFRTHRWLTVAGLVWLVQSEQLNAQAYCEPCAQLDANTANCEELFLTVTVNAVPIEEPFLIYKTSDTFWLPSRATNAFNIHKQPTDAQLNICEDSYTPHSAFKGAQARYDARNLALYLQLPANLFSKQSLDNGTPLIATPDFAPLGLTLQYDFAAIAEDVMQASTFADMRFTYGTSSGNLNFTVSDIFGDPKAVRRSTAWQFDNPKNLTSLTLGDSVVGRSRAFRGNIFYGGIQYSSNTSLQRGVSTLQRLQLDGIAEFPSTVDLYIDNVLRDSQNVAPGPFEVDHTVGFTQDGNVELVIRDALGREQVITTEFFADTELLNLGSSEFSFDAGFARENLGIKDFDYGDWFSSGSYTRGLARHFTGAAEAEISNQHIALGASGIWVPAARSKLSFAAAGSHHENLGAGSFGRLRLSQYNQRIGVNIGAELTTKEFSRVGSSDTGSNNKLNAFANASINGFRYGKLNMGTVYSETHNNDVRRLANFGYSKGIAGFSFSVNGSQDLDDQDQWFVGVNISRRIGRTRHQASGNFSKNKQRYSYSSSYEPEGENYSYSVSSSFGPNLNTSGALGFSGFNEDIAYNIGTNYGGLESTPVSLQLRGGFGHLKGYTFAARETTNGYALIHVPEHPKVGVIQGGRVGETDENGYFLLPLYDYYRPIQFSLDTNDLPLGVDAGRIKRTVVPAYRSALYVPFNLKYQRNAMLRLIDKQGRPFIGGTVVSVNNSKELATTSAYGEVYLENLRERSNVLKVAGKNCRIEFNYNNKTRDPLPFLGDYRCAN